MTLHILYIFSTVGPTVLAILAEQGELLEMNVMISIDLFIFVLLILGFYIHFGQESLSKYLDESIFTIEEKVDFHQEAPPAVTICALKEGLGWKHDAKFETNVKNVCVRQVL